MSVKSGQVPICNHNHSSVRMMFLMVAAGSKPSVRRAGFCWSMPMKIMVGSPCICVECSISLWSATGCSLARLRVLQAWT